MATTGYFELSGEGLPADVQVPSFDAREAISELFEAWVEVTTADVEFAVAECLKKSLALRVFDTEGERVLHGICDAAELTGFTGLRSHYRLRLRPALAGLSRREDNRIYQDKSPVDVVKELLAAAGVEKVEWRLTATYAPRAYIVQYRETELAFLSRLIEDEGIFYFFEHDTGEHVLVFGDDPSAFTQSPPVPVTRGAVAGESPLMSLSRTRRLRTTLVQLRDYDFEKPGQLPKSEQAGDDRWPASHYEHPGGFVAGAEGSRRATARLRELRRDADVIRGASRAPGIRVGAPLSIAGADPPALDGTYVVTELVSRGTEGHGEDAGGRMAVQVEYAAIPEGAPFAAPRRTPKPRIHGVQTATVTGPTSDEQAIHCDKYGRVKVRFHWDRVGQYDDKASCWLRVLQPPMGGSIIIPRVGWEVAVAFFHGDPDQPFVVGRLYNGLKGPPYPLPGTQTSGSLKSLSSPGAGGHNEVCLADSGGSQGFGVHAQKDLNTTVGHDKSETIGANEKHDVKVNMVVTVGSNETVSVGGSQAVDVGSVCSANVGGGQTLLVGGNMTDNATANYVEKVAGDRSYTVGGNMTVISNTVMQTIGGSLSRTVGAAMIAASVKSIAETTSGSYTETVGAIKVDLCKGVCSEAVGGAKTCTAAAAEIHLVKGSLSQSCEAAVTQLVGGLHYQKIAGDYSVSAPMITLLGAIGDFKAGGSNLKLGGGPIVLKSSKITTEGAMIIKMGGSLKIGPG